MNIIEIKKEDLLAKADIYRVLARAFSYPDKETIESLKLLCDDIAVADIPGNVRERFLAFKHSFINLAADEIEAEYNELFMTRMFCPPYETSYGRNSFSRPETLSDISAFYKAFGFSMSDGEEMLDHIAVEMEFMSLLLLKEAYGVEQGLNDMTDICDSANKKFLGDHLGRWVRPFCNNLTEKTTIDFYKNLAVFTEQFVEGEIACYGIDVKYTEGFFKDELVEEPITCAVDEDRKK